MALSEAEAVDRAKYLLSVRDGELQRLERIQNYLRDDPAKPLPWLPPDAPLELHRLARVSRVNLLKFIVNSRVQSMYVDGFRTPRSSENVDVWRAWQANKMDARQIGIHRAALAYGVSYVVVLDGEMGGEAMPVMRGVSPLNLTAAYGEDDDWPQYAIERRGVNPDSRRRIYRLYDAEAVYTLEAAEPGEVEFVDVNGHSAGVTPVVRYRDTMDLDDPAVGIVEPHIFLQDQINITTFGLLVAQHYGAFKQRYVIGWLADSEEQKLKAAAQKIWTFEDENVKVGEFSQTDLNGYIASREATLRHLATVSQTPAHELTGQLVNMSAEALAAAEASKMRAVAENRECVGESHEQTLGLVGRLMGVEVPPEAEVVWRDTESRSLAQVADALGKLVQMLGVPPEELWELIPGVSQQQVERWKARAAEGDALDRLASMLDRQAQPGPQPSPQPGFEAV